MAVANRRSVSRATAAKSNSFELNDFVPEGDATREITIKFKGNAKPLLLTLDTSNYTVDRQVAIEEALTGNLLGKAADLFFSQVIAWNLTIDGDPVPVEQQYWRRFHLEVIAKMLNTLAEDVADPKSETSNA